MQLLLKGTAIGLALVSSGCAVRSYEYRDRPTTTVVTTACDPMYPCANTYYWDEWRGVYVFYDGYRYYDALGAAGTYPLPPRDIIITYPPPTYVPPSAYRPPRGTYYAPHRYSSPPQRWHEAVPANNRGYYADPGSPVFTAPQTSGQGRSTYVPPPSSGGNYVPPPGYVAPGSSNQGGNYTAPGGYVPPRSGSGNYVPPPPPSSGNGNYVPPPSSGGYVAPPGSGNSGYVAPPPSGNSGYVAPPPSGNPGYVAPPPSGNSGYAAPPPSGNSGYVAPSTSGNSAGSYAPPPPVNRGGGYVAPSPSGNDRGGVVTPPAPQPNTGYVAPAPGGNGYVRPVNPSNSYVAPTTNAPGGYVPAPAPSRPQPGYREVPQHNTGAYVTPAPVEQPAQPQLDTSNRSNGYVSPPQRPVPPHIVDPRTPPPAQPAAPLPVARPVTRPSAPAPEAAPDPVGKPAIRPPGLKR
jgi:hypothetical protein